MVLYCYCANSSQWYYKEGENKKMKKVKLLLTMAAIAFATMICCSISAFALTEGDWEFKLLDNQVTISKYIGENEDIVVPKTIAGCPVTKIEAHAFNKNIVSITFHDMIKEIPSFSYHSKLETVVLPEGIEIIPDSAFLECKSLKNINDTSQAQKNKFPPHNPPPETISSRKTNYHALNTASTRLNTELRPL